ncbi:MAG: 3-dehydroquinate synthase [Armatimonadetes bacterium]|nr:3-dehydroquinate synthase [Armatimonadota bacterium]
MTVSHSRGQYEVELTDVAGALRSISADDCVITDENVRDALGLSVEHLAVRPGESSKSMAVYGQAMDWLSDRARRGTRVVALGGGVVGDLAGFAAATFMRGVRLLQIPTSLLAMVDSAVGGKVGIDLAAGKNLAGAFWPPERVLIPVDALGTLPERHFVNGAAEVWKYGAIMSPGLFERLERSPLRPGSPDIGQVVMECVGLKRQVVEEDEFETTGRRAVLNFGHTVGHALEHSMGYQGLLHGEAVSIGMVLEARIAASLGVAGAGLADRLAAGLDSQGLPTTMPDGLSTHALIGAMRRDKKAGQNGLSFSLVSEIGACKLHAGVDEGAVRAVLEKR